MKTTEDTGLKRKRAKHAIIVEGSHEHGAGNPFANCILSTVTVICFALPAHICVAV